MADCDQNDIIRAAARGRWNSLSDVINVFWYQMTSSAGLTAAEVAEDIGDILETLYDYLDTFQHVSYSYKDITYFNVTQNKPLGAWDWPSLNAGTANYDALPTGVAAFIFARTGYNRIIGRKYLGVFTENDCGNGGWGSSLMTNLGYFAAWWLVTGWEQTNGDWDQGIYSAGNATLYPIEEVVVRQVPGYQRRRKQGVGA